jgi:hypothetical protein
MFSELDQPLGMADPSEPRRRVEISREQAKDEADPRLSAMPLRLAAALDLAAGVEVTFTCRSYRR